MKSFQTKYVRVAAGLVLGMGMLRAQAPTQTLPSAPGKETVQRICGACHSVTMVLGQGRTRSQWSEVVSNMITRGAKGTPAEFAEVVDYLAKNLPANARGANSAPLGGGRKRRFPAGPSDEQIVDPSAAGRGQALYTTNCAACHGPLARGTSNGPDLVRSVTVLHDRYGDTLGPFLASNHPLTSSLRLPSFTENQIKDLSNFLHEQVSNTLRSGPYTNVINVLTGNASAGAAYFNGEGGCNKCHSPAGDLAGIASRYDAAALQQRFLFPRALGFGRGGGFAAIKPVTVTVNTPDGDNVSGVLLHLDDFNVSLKDADGNYHSWKRTPQIKIEEHDPYLAHDELLDKYTDRDIHNVVAYLETLK